MENTISENRIKSEKTTQNDNSMADKYRHIKGWGIDANPDNDPTYPMKHYNGSDHHPRDFDRPAQQPVNIEILKTIERKNISATFGTSSPPSGVSGALRRYAFNFSEESLRHWFTLVLADRVNVVEGIIDDVKHGHFPNIFAEKGLKAGWKYNKKGLIKNMLITAAVATVAVAAVTKKIKKEKAA